MQSSLQLLLAAMGDISISWQQHNHHSYEQEITLLQATAQSLYLHLNPACLFHRSAGTARQVLAYLTINAMRSSGLARLLLWAGSYDCRQA
jgi:hypothetical protein